jgi:DNA invertase Pin-like site-specific DNA recombinase
LSPIVNGLHAREIAFRSLKETMDTSTATGTLLFHVFASLAQFERDMINERAAAGRQAAKDRGHTGGRPLKLTPDKIEAARSLVAAGKSVTAAAAAVGVSRTSLYRALTPATA